MELCIAKSSMSKLESAKEQWMTGIIRDEVVGTIHFAMDVGLFAQVGGEIEKCTETEGRPQCTWQPGNRNLIKSRMGRCI